MDVTERAVLKLKKREEHMVRIRQKQQQDYEQLLPQDEPQQQEHPTQEQQQPQQQQQQPQQQHQQQPQHNQQQQQQEHQEQALEKWEKKFF